MVLAPWGSELASVKVQGVPAVHAGGVKAADGSSLAPVSPPPSPPQAHAPARMTVVAVSSRIDRIESSQPRVTVESRNESAELVARDCTRPARRLSQRRANQRHRGQAPAPQRPSVGATWT